MTETTALAIPLRDLGDNTAIGADSSVIIMMLGNTPYGCHALEGNTTGRGNTAIGLRALVDNAMGNNNTAIGFRALVDDAMGSNNTAIGYMALSATLDQITSLWARGRAVITWLGTTTSTSATRCMASEEGQIRIGSSGLHTGTYIAGIRNAAVSGSPVVVGMDGKLGVTMSSAQFKEAIKPMDKASEAILALKPVTFHYKKEVDPDGIPQFGLVAEQVEKVNPDLVARDAEGKVHRALRSGERDAAQRVPQRAPEKVGTARATVARQEKQIEALTAGLQKVSAQLEASKPAPRVVNKVSSAAENLSRAGWSWGCVATVDSNGRTIWIADAHRESVQLVRQILARECRGETEI